MMSLQLYQVDYKSYLLDFKSLSSDENETGSSSEPDIFNQRDITCNLLFVFIAFECSLTNVGGSSGHLTMEFFEMCAALITQLAR